MTPLRSAIALVSSRRVRVVAVLVALMAARWRLLGRPDGAELAAFAGVLVSWVVAESRRRHAAGSILASRRLLLSLLGLVLSALGGRLGLDLGPEAQAALVGPLVALVLGEGERRHPDAREPALVVPLDGGGAPRADTGPSGVR